jgi:hypothetical protein
VSYAERARRASINVDSYGAAALFARREPYDPGLSPLMREQRDRWDAERTRAYRAMVRYRNVNSRHVAVSTEEI